jgi:hypothetical protein
MGYYLVAQSAESSPDKGYTVNLSDDADKKRQPSSAATIPKLTVDVNGFTVGVDNLLRNLRYLGFLDTYSSRAAMPHPHRNRVDTKYFSANSASFRRTHLWQMDSSRERSSY